MSSRYSLATLGRVSLHLRFAPVSSTDAIRQTPCAFASVPVSVAPKPDSLQKEASGDAASLLATPPRVAPVGSTRDAANPLCLCKLSRVGSLP